MSKRVHEVAKELGKTNKEVLETLAGQGIEIKSHMSMLNEEQEEMLKKIYAGEKKAAPSEEKKTAPSEEKKTAPPEEKKAASPEEKKTVSPEEKKAAHPEEKKAAPAEEKKAPPEEKKAAAPQTPPKKKKIIAVYNAHNSQTGIRDPREDRNKQQGQRSDQRRSSKNGGPSSRQTQSMSGRPTGTTRIRPKTDGPIRPSDNVRPEPDESEPVRQAAPVSEKAAAEKAVRTEASSPVQNNAVQSSTAQSNVPEPEKKTASPVQESAQAAAQPEKAQSAARAQKPAAQAERDRRPSQAASEAEAHEAASGETARRENRESRSTSGRDGRQSQNREGQRNSSGQSREGRSYQGREGRAGQEREGQNREGRGSRNSEGHTSSGARGGQNSRRSMDIPSAPVEARKAENRRSENKSHYDENKKDKSSKFNDNWDGRPGQGNRKQNQGGNRPNQKNNRGAKSTAPVRPAAPAPKKEEQAPRVIEIPEVISIHDLAENMKIQPSVIIKKLFMEGKMVTLNSELDFEAAGELAMEMNFDPVPEEKEDVIAKMLEDVEDDEDSLVPRPPVVSVLGHVDHGKTSILDAIRDTHVTDREAGGITQHIGAYVVNVGGQSITFLDTPGHEAFTAMRMRGANSTDIAILVVAADDGVMPQTIEAINHAKAANTEIIVAVNKIDLPGANVDRVKQELTEYGLVPEDWGGDTVFVPVSAQTHEGLDQLLEMILLTAEVMELKANPNRRARGLIIEAQLDKGKGPVATVLVQKGTLHVGDPIAVGSCHGKVRAMMDENGRRVKEAGPSIPVEILGLNDVPNAGDIFVSPETEKEARTFAETYVKENREKLLEDTKMRMSLDDLYSQIESGNMKELNIIIKADVQGSVEAIRQSLEKLSNEEVEVKVIHGAVGAITESDVSLAATSGAIIIGFNVKPDATAKEMAENEHVDVRLYSVIYDAIDDVEAAMKGMLDPIYEEKVIGHGEIRQIFKASGIGNIAGSYVTDGVFQRGCKCRVFREGTQLFDGPLASLKRFKDDVKEVRAGYECGLVFEKFNDIKELDTVEAYIMVEVPR